MNIVYKILYGLAMGAVMGICIAGYQEIKKLIEKHKIKKDTLI